MWIGILTRRIQPKGRLSWLHDLFLDLPPTPHLQKKKKNRDCTSDWICKKMAIEISLRYVLTDSCCGWDVFFFIVTFIYLISTEYLLNRLQYIDFDEFLTGH